MKQHGINKKILHYSEYIMLMILDKLFVILPESLIYRIATLFGTFTFHVIRFRRDVTIENLQRAYPEMSDSEVIDLAKRSYVSISYSFIEMLMIERFIKNIRERVEFEGLELIRNHANNGSGVIIVSSHFGSWELTGAGIVGYGFPLSAIAKRQSNPYVNDFIIRQRNSLGMKIMSHGVSVRHIVKAIRNSEVVVLVSDQDSGKKGVFVNFFGKPASTATGAAQLALRYNTPIVVALTYRIRPGYYRLVSHEIPIYTNDTIEGIVQRYTSVMEMMIRKHPEQYFWMHRRWKTQISQLNQ